MPHFKPEQSSLTPITTSTTSPRDAVSYSNNNVQQRFPPQLIRSTYILYIEAISRILQGFCYSSFHTAPNNAIWSSIGNQRANSRAEFAFPPGSIPIGTLSQALAACEHQADLYQINAERLLNKQHKNVPGLLYQPTGDRFEGEPIPYGYDRMTIMTQHCIELFIEMLLDPDQFELIQSIDLIVPDEKLPVYLEDFLSPHQQDQIDTDLFTYDYGIDDNGQIRTDNDYQHLDMVPLFDTFKQHNRGHLTKAIPAFIWDWVYKEDQPEVDRPHHLSSLILTRKTRLFALAHSFPSRYTRFSNETSPTPGLFTYFDQFDNFHNIREKNGILAPTPHLLNPERNFKFRPHYPYQPPHRRDYQYLLSRLSDEDYDQIPFPTRNNIQTNTTTRMIDTDYGDDHEIVGSEIYQRISSLTQLYSPLHPTTSLPIGSDSPFSYQHQRILLSDKSTAADGKNNFVAPTHPHLPFFYNHSDEELDLLHVAFSSHRLFEISTNKDLYPQWRNEFKSRQMVPSPPIDNQSTVFSQLCGTQSRTQCFPISTQTPVLSQPSFIDNSSKSLLHLLPTDHTFTSVNDSNTAIKPVLSQKYIQDIYGQDGCFVDLELFYHNVNEFDGHGFGAVIIQPKGQVSAAATDPIIQQLHPCDSRANKDFMMNQDESDLMQQYIDRLRGLRASEGLTLNTTGRDNNYSIFDQDVYFTVQTQRHCLDLTAFPQHTTILPSFRSTVSSSALLTTLYKFGMTYSALKGALFSRLVGQHKDISSQHLFDHQAYSLNHYPLAR